MSFFIFGGGFSGYFASLDFFCGALYGERRTFLLIQTLPSLPKPYFFICLLKLDFLETFPEKQRAPRKKNRATTSENRHQYFEKTGFHDGKCGVGGATAMHFLLFLFSIF